MLRLSSGLIQVGAALFAAPLVVLVLARSGAWLPLMPWGVGIAALGLLAALLDGH